jgi:hypothetical protein
MSIALFAVFAVVLTLVLLTGAAAFRTVAAQAEERFESRTPLMYVTQKLRAFDRVDSVQIIEIHDARYLKLSDENFDIYIYHHDGYLTEFLAFSGDYPRLEIGTKLFKADSVEFEWAAESLLRVTIDGSEVYVSLSARGGDS